MSFTFDADNTTEMMKKAKGNKTEITSKLEKKLAQKGTKGTKEKVRHSLYLDKNMMAKLQTLSMKYNLSVNNIILDLISKELADVQIDEELVMNFIEHNKNKGIEAKNKK